jgi:hypothetical protein
VSLAALVLDCRQRKYKVGLRSDRDVNPRRVVTPSDPIPMLWITIRTPDGSLLSSSRHYAGPGLDVEASALHEALRARGLT